MNITSFSRNYWKNLRRFACEPLWPAVLVICLYLQFLIFGPLGLILMFGLFLLTGSLDAISSNNGSSSDARQKRHLGSAYAMMALLLVAFLIGKADPIPLFPALMLDLLHMTVISLIASMLVWTGPEVARWMRE